MPSILVLISDHAELNNSSGIFTYDVAKSVLSDATLQDLLQETRELAYVDLSLLTSREQLLCFYGNVVNLFTVHTLLHYIGIKHPKVQQLSWSFPVFSM